jgi:hypothetical protein
MRAVVRTSTRALSSSPAAGGLSVLDYFTPFNQQDLNNQDVERDRPGLALVGDKAERPART